MAFGDGACKRNRQIRPNVRAELGDVSGLRLQPSLIHIKQFDSRHLVPVQHAVAGIGVPCCTALT